MYVAPLGYGPYKLVEWKKGDHITFAPNEFWSGDAPKTPNLIYKFYSDSARTLLVAQSTAVAAATAFSATQQNRSGITIAGFAASFPAI